MSPGADLGDVTRMLYVIVDRGSALYSRFVHGNISETIQSVRSRCAQLTVHNWPWAEVAYSHEGVTAAQDQSACVQAAAGRAWYARV